MFIISKYKSLLFGSFIFTSILGPFMHFAYEASGENPFVSIIAPVNESVWEHTKLVFFPFLLFLLIIVLFCRQAPNNFFSGVFIGSLFGIISVPILFYLYTFFTKEAIFVFDISIFFIAVLIEHIIAFKVFNAKPLPFSLDYLFSILIVCIFILFSYLTSNPPKLDMFKTSMLCLFK